MSVLAVRRLLAVLGLVVAVALLAAIPGQAQSARTKCTAVAALKPGNEVPPADSETSGAAAVHINGTRLSFAVAIANPERERFFAGHIHIGAAGVNGPVRVLLFSGSNDRRLFTQFDSIQISATDAAAICGNLAGHYVNYHTDDFPGGALRGQLVRLF
jgi:CHRD domain